jgi:hypothetical protein
MFLGSPSDSLSNRFNQFAVDFVLTLCLIPLAAFSKSTQTPCIPHSFDARYHNHNQLDLGRASRP